MAQLRTLSFLLITSSLLFILLPFPSSLPSLPLLPPSLPPSLPPFLSPSLPPSPHQTGWMQLKCFGRGRDSILRWRKKGRS